MFSLDKGTGCGGVVDVAVGSLVFVGTVVAVAVGSGIVAVIVAVLDETSEDCVSMGWTVFDEQP